ncbi:hypothetical protein CL614_04650 [archaeon]|nr:hypothetical protein [archaeon]
MENKTNQKEEHISQIESKIGESPFLNYYSNSFGDENAKIKKSNDVELLPEKENREIKNTNKDNKRKDKKIEMGSFDFKSEFDKMKRDMLTSLRDNLNLNIPEAKENIENQYNANITRVSKNFNTTKPTTINKEYNNITNPLTINKDYSHIDNNTFNKNINKSYPLNKVIKDTTNIKNVSNKMNKIQNSVENSIIKSINNNKNYTKDTTKNYTTKDTTKNYTKDTTKNYTKDTKNYITKNVSLINELKPESVHNALNITSTKSITPNPIAKENIPNIIQNFNTAGNHQLVRHEIYSNPQHYIESMPNIIKEEKETPILPGLAEGGLVNKPTKTVIAEAGPELAIPLEKTPEIIGQAIEKSKEVSSRSASQTINQNQTQKLNNQNEGGEVKGGPAVLTNENANFINAPSMPVSGSGITKFDRSVIRNIALPSWRTNLG